jgi:sugar lactone lactonase YvrE
MDKAGRLFVAHASLGHVFVFAPNGELVARVKSCAGPACTNVAIAGANRDRLYITEFGDRHYPGRRHQRIKLGRVLIDAHAMSAFGGIAEKRCSS